MYGDTSLAGQLSGETYSTVPAEDGTEARRLQALRSLDVMGATSEERFQRIVRIGARLLNAPICAINLIDETRQWTLCAVGGPECSGERSDALCAHTIASDAVLAVHDTLADPRFATKPQVRDGWRFYCGAPLVMPGGERIGAVCVGGPNPRYVTADEQATLRDLAALVVDGLLLRHRLRDQDAALADARTSRKAAEDLSTSRSRFIADISHEIRNPLNGILGFASLIEEGTREPDTRKLAQSIRHSGEMLASIVNDVLDHAKIEAGFMELDRGPFEVAALVEHCASLFGVVARSKGLDFNAGLIGGPAHAVGDARRLQQVLNNIVGNAVKFTGAGSVDLTARCTPHGLQAWDLEFVVRDSGIGMSDAQLANLFKPFRQGDSSTARRFGGTGLGLAISRALIEAMGGQLDVRSAPGEGTTATLSMRLPAIQVAPATPIDPPRTATRKLRILVADDAAVNRTLLHALLARRGHAVRMAENGTQALQIALERWADVILMDVEMPEMDGLEVTRRVRAAERQGGPRVPIVGLSGRAFQHDITASLRAGMDAHLPKPYRVNELEALLHQLVHTA